MEVDQPESEKKPESNTAATIVTANESELITATKPSDEDEEFEEFPVYYPSAEANSNAACQIGNVVQQTATMSSSATLPPTNVWEDNWDDETVETDFHKQLEEELKKRGLKLDP